MRSELLAISSEIRELAARFSIDNSNIARLADLDSGIRDRRIKVPLLGSFNAGKSTLLNTLLDRRGVLPTDIKAETALAAELVPGSPEGLEVVSPDGSVSFRPLGDLKTLDPKGARYVRVILDSPLLRDLKDITLVDMPGLDSSLEAHNQAIARYLDEGSFFLILADVEQQVRGSVLDFIRTEVLPLGAEFAFVLTKSDMVDPETGGKTRKLTEETLTKVTGRPCRVLSLSAVEKNFQDLLSLLKGLDTGKMLARRYTPALQLGVLSLRRGLLTIKAGMDSASGEIEEVIRKIQENQQLLDRRMKEESRRIKDKFASETLDLILYDVEKALQDRIEALAAAAKTGGDTFGRQLTGLVRTALVQSTRQRVNAVFETSLEGLQDFQMELQEQEFNFTMPNFAGMEEMMELLKKIDHPIIKQILTVIAVVTDFVAPWIELILVFLPDILKLFSNQDEQIRSKILTEVIPQVREKLRPEIQPALEKLREDFMEQVEAQFNAERETQKKLLEKALEDKRLSEEEKARRTQELEAALTRCGELEAALPC